MCEKSSIGPLGFLINAFHSVALCYLCNRCSFKELNADHRAVSVKDRLARIFCIRFNRLLWWFGGKLETAFPSEKFVGRNDINKKSAGAVSCL
jgi:hypothetical protein